MYKFKSPPLVTLLLAVLALLAFGAVSLHAEDVIVTGTIDGSGTLRSCPPSCPANLGTTVTSSSYSTAVPAGVSPRKTVICMSNAGTWEVEPTVASTGGGYKVYVTKGTTGSCPADLLINITNISGCTLYDTNGVAQTSIITPYFQRAFLNNWYFVGIISNTMTNPRIGFSYNYSASPLASANRWYMDEVRFESMDPCAGVATQPTVTGPLAAGSNYVIVTSVAAKATNITVYANLTTPIAVTNKATGFGSSSVKVWLDTGLQLNRGDTITATVIATNSLGGACDSPVPISGPVVGSGGPKMIISLGVQKNGTLTGPIGTATPSPGTDLLYWVKATGTASGLSGTAPVGGYEVVPSECWQTLTFNWQTDPCIGWLGNATYVETNAFAVLESLAIGIDGNDLDSGPYLVYVDKIMNGTNLLADFEGYNNGTANINFANATATATPPSGYFLGNPMSTTTSTNGAFSGTNSCRIEFQFVDNAPIRWARMLMNQAPRIYPQVDTHQPVTMSVLVLPADKDFAHQFTGTMSGVSGYTPAYTTGTNTLAVIVSGPGPYTYQWSRSGWGQIGGATETSYKVGDVAGGLTTGDSGLYTLTVNDGTCSYDVSANLTVQDPIPVIINELPAKVIKHVGENLTLSVGASAAVVGGYPLTYQWEFNGVAIPDATGSSFTTNNVQIADAGSYDVIVANSFLVAGVTSVVAVLDVVQPGVVVGTGTGLRAEYYTLQTNGVNQFMGAPTISRTDATINFDWLDGSPNPAISADYFTARWYGQVQALDTDTYTFYTRTDDGVRLWVNGQELVNSWIPQSPTEHSGTIALTANTKYPILMEYFEQAGGAVAQLSWSGAGGGVVKEIVPQSQLYLNSPSEVPQPQLSFGVADSTNLVFNWPVGPYSLTWATNVTGPYTNVAYGGVGPFTYTNAFGPQPAKFFRLQSY
jgi:hypothetical protein